MELATQIELALAAVCAGGFARVHENGEWLAALDGLQYRVRAQDDGALLHLWGSQQSLVRRVVRVAEQSPERLVLEVSRLGRPRPAKLEFFAAAPNRDDKCWGRDQFRSRLHQLLTDHFADEVVDSLVTGADLKNSISGSYTRGLMHRGSDAFAIIGAGPQEDSATINGILTFGILWLDLSRNRARRHALRGLRLFLPRGSSAATAHRVNALASPQEIEIYEYDPQHWRLRRVAISDAGNLDTWLVSRREMEQALATALPEMERIRQLAPEAIHATVSAPMQEVALRFRGLEFARWRQGMIWFGLGDHQEMLIPERWPAVEKLVRQLENYRHPLATETKHSLYRAQPERWLETIVAADSTRIDARLDPKHVYSQVPASSAGDRGIMDLIGVTRDGRLAVLELKASEDIQLVMQAVDYWLRVRWHLQQDDFRRYGYFTGVELQAKAPLLFLVGPGFQFHPSSNIVLRYLSPEIEVVRIGLTENWRRGLRVIFRQ